MALNRSPKMLEVMVNYAKDLRRNQTESEKMLWQSLRERKLGGWRFMRQRPILIDLHGVATFAVADFYCAAARLVIEVDGRVHDRQRKEDEARDRALQQRGYSVLRIAAEDVELHLPHVLEHIASEARRRAQERDWYDIPPSPVLGEGGNEGE